MRDRFDVSLARQIGDPAGDGEAAAAREIGLEDVDVAALHAKAIANVAREEVELERVDVENVEMIAVSGSFYAAEKLLDRAFMRRLHGMLGAEILAASVPRRGLLLVVAANPEDPASLALLGAATEAESKTTRAISEAMASADST